MYESELNLFRANFYIKTCKYDKAIEILEKLRELEPTDESILFGLATSYAGNNQLDEAWKICELLQQHHPNERTETMVKVLKNFRKE